ncbi:hypothetical protein Fmac_005500 [Flemingia macrophylla]|uniref:RING-type E3 ubiquitin transferase n=1 Tax=Flemingia macrophylla TaxID=520843 RepID=A0ABD1N813_9FABA
MQVRRLVWSESPLLHANDQERKVPNKAVLGAFLPVVVMSTSEYEMSPAAAPFNTPPALIAFTLGILVVCFVAFSIVYLCKYCFTSVIQTWAFHRTASGSLIRLTPHRSPPRGLDPSLLHVFPTFPYSSVKDLRKEKYSLECAICLLEFEEDNVLRLLTLCCHVFHQDCIDLWLRSHKTCPVCRRDLDAPDLDQKFSVEDPTAVVPSNGDVLIDVIEDNNNNDNNHINNVSNNGNQRQGSEGGGEESRGGGGHVHDDQAVNIRQQPEQMFVRSHSTGHSVVLIRDEEGKEKGDEKYTLRLPPEQVLREKHHCTRSCASIKDMVGLAAVAPCGNCGFVQSLQSAGCSSPPQTQKP